MTHLPPIDVLKHIVDQFMQYEFPGMELGRGDVIELQHVVLLEDGLPAQAHAIHNQLHVWYEERIARPHRVAERRKALRHTPLRRASKAHATKAMKPAWQR